MLDAMKAAYTLLQPEIIFTKLFFFFKGEGTHTLFGSSFSAAKPWTFTNSADTFPILKVPQQKDS